VTSVGRGLPLAPRTLSGALIGTRFLKIATTTSTCQLLITRRAASRAAHPLRRSR
jgi:hypothetical protein